MQVVDQGNWNPRWVVRKYHEDLAEWQARGGTDADFYATFRPYETVGFEGNLWLNAGISLMLDLFIGAGGTVFNAANARLGVGDSTTAAAAGQTDLQAAANKLRKGMDTTYPSRSAQTLSFQASFTSTEANYDWNEFILANAATGATVFNRKVQALGTKTGGTWQIQLQASLS